jgi:hypothetical protein
MDESQFQIGEPDVNAYPNAGLNFYYSREKRFKNAPEKRKDRNAPPSGKGGFLRSLTGTTPKLILFITICVLCVVIMVLQYATN